MVQDLVLVSKKASGFDGIWSAVSSQLTMDQARILAGDGASRSTAFSLKETEATFFNTDIALYGASSNTGFQVTGGRLDLQKCNLSLLKGEEFNQGIVLDHSVANLDTLQLKIETGSYQGGATADGGTLTMRSSTVQVAGGGQRVWGAQFLDPCAVSLEDVTWILGTKTPGELWKITKPWIAGSTETGTIAKGW